jgi:hypothetical protein
MLINTTKYDKGDIVSFKLVNGDEIVARIVEDLGEEFTIHKPCTVMPSPKGLGLIQSLFTSDLNKDIKLSKSHVMMHTITQKDVENHYIQTTTGIQTAAAGSIVT